MRRPSEPYLIPMNNRPTVAAIIAMLALVSGCAIFRGRPDVKATRFDRLVMERTACFGSCPAYRITVHADGRYVYEGTYYVKRKDTIEGFLTAEQIRAIDTAIINVDYPALRARYAKVEDGCTYSDNSGDGSAAILSLTRGADVKQVYHYHGCIQSGYSEREGVPILEVVYPPKLWQFEQTLDSIVGTREWVGTLEERRGTWGF